MNFAHRRTGLIVTGQSGTGKTTFWLRYLQGERVRMRFVFDGEGEVSHKLRIMPATRPDELAAACERGTWCVFDPGVMFPGRNPEAFAFFCDFAFQAGQRIPGRKLFACDELQKLVGVNSCPWELSCILETGRRHELDSAIITQQCNLVHNRVRSQTTEAVTFRHVEDRALAWLSAVGFDPEAVCRLPGGRFIARNLESCQESNGKVF